MLDALLPRVTEAVERFLETGRHDEFRYGASYEGMRRACDELIDALIGEVARRSRGRRCPRVPKGVDSVSLARAKLGPMVRGLFSVAERDAVLAMLERSVVFVTRQNIEEILRGQGLLSSAWDLANLYLSIVGAELLSPEAPQVVGLSQHTTCYVSAHYFREGDPFEDFVVHEAAHVFHNCKRRTIGLRETRGREWLLEIEFTKREEFAYSCEVYSRITAAGGRPAQRVAMAEKFAASNWVSEERTDPAEVADIVREAAAARNGWKVILRRCAPRRSARRGGPVVVASP